MRIWDFFLGISFVMEEVKLVLKVFKRERRLEESIGFLEDRFLKGFLKGKKLCGGFCGCVILLKLILKNKGD